MKLVKITSDNLDTALALAREIFPDEIHDGEFWPEVAYKQAIATNQPTFAYYLAYFNDVLIGITGHYPEGDDFACQTLHDDWYLSLGWFGVRPALRRRQFGSQMLEATMQLVFGMGSPQLRLYCKTDDTGALAFYHHHHFRQYATGSVDGDAVIYLKTSLT